MRAYFNKFVTRASSTPLAMGRTLYPGVALAAVIGLAAVFLAGHYGAPVMLLALLVGMAFHGMAEEQSIAPGITFSAKTLLRAGVALLGVRVSLHDIASLGLAGFGAIAGLLVGTILLGVLLSRRDWQFGVLTGGAVAICGASAALAIAACLPRARALEQETFLTVALVTALSTLAMILYPVILGHLDLTQAQIAFVLGAAIHDVAQVVGAGLTVSEETAELATLVKMVRVSLLPIVLAGLILFCTTMRGQSASQKIPVPAFLIVFFMLAIAANTGAITPDVITWTASLSKGLLIIAIGALGARTSLQGLLMIGGGKIMRMGGLTVSLFGASILAAMVLPGLS